MSIKDEELEKLKVIADFIYDDEYQDKAGFPQFEKRMSLFFVENPIALDKVFKDLCGEKRKFTVA